MAAGNKPEFAPLLPPGRHLLSLRDIKKICVEPLVGSPTRERLLDSLERLVNASIVHKISCELWIDGSFLTEKHDPADIDLSVKIDADVLQALDRDAVNLLRSIANGGFEPDLDSYIVTSYPIGDPRRGTNLDLRSYWAQWWRVAAGAKEWR